MNADYVRSAEAVPGTMRAMVLDEFGGDSRLERRPVPASNMCASRAV